MKKEQKSYAIFTQGDDNHYGLKAGDITWVHEVSHSELQEGEFIYVKYSKHSGTYGIVKGDTVESDCEDEIYNLSDCRPYRVEDEEVKRVAEGMTANLNPSAYPHLENV